MGESAYNITPQRVTSEFLYGNGDTSIFAKMRSVPES